MVATVDGRRKDFFEEWSIDNHFRQLMAEADDGRESFRLVRLMMAVTMVMRTMMSGLQS